MIREKLLILLCLLSTLQLCVGLNSNLVIREMRDLQKVRFSTPAGSVHPLVYTGQRR